MAKRSKYVKPSRREFLRAEVLASRQLSPHFVRVTVGGPQLARFQPMGYDQWFRLFLPNGRGVLRAPSNSQTWVAQYMLESLKSRENRPVGRNYTVRDFRQPGRGVHGEGAELDIDFALHQDAEGHMGPATRWATTARPGDPLVLYDEGITYQPTPDARWQLLVGDETALPAIAGVIGSAGEELRAEVFVEIPHPEDAQKLELPEGVRLNWLPRRDGSEPTGTLALRAVRQAELPEGPGYAFLAGAQSMVSGLRRHLVDDRGLAKEAITFTGYWR
ncbi:siderophore-interacting protein [Streptomyces sp. NPDC005438]|uniref:siderophore-interacting protein n=1 Tax=Streptomyces sp. NPDC005438 TaxID=3156880 RepID=UPI0033B4F067